MSFFFKSKRPNPGSPGIPPSSRKITSRDGPNGAVPTPSGPEEIQMEGERARSGSANGAPMTGSSAARSAPSPTPGQRHVVPRGQMMPDPSRQGPRRPPHQQPPDASLYPWSEHRFAFTDNSNPFPRYGASLNGAASPSGEIYMMGGLIDGATVKSDLFLVEAGKLPMKCYQVETSAIAPGSRVGHASLLVGNAFIVFGGDTKLEETDVLDDTLYLLNTSSRHWSKVAPAGPRPPGRYGHTLNIIGSRIYIFGGQVDGYFFNDLLAFDLNLLQSNTSHWEVMLQNSADGGPTVGQMPPARTNHTIVTYDDKLYLFGGTDGVSWFNDVWTYDPRTNAWTDLECIGFIPTPREGHAAALVGDVMYTFGGRTEEGKDLGDVAGFRIPTKRWYTFQNMGPSPSGRSGHGMISYEDKILVFGGEPSSAPRNEQELSQCYVLDTSKIRYPEDKPSAKAGVTRRPSITDRSGTPQSQQEQSTSRDGSVSSQQGSRALMTKGSQDSMASNNAQFARPQDGPSAAYVNGIIPRPTRSAPSPVPGQSAPQVATQARTNGIRPGMQSAGIEGRESPRLVSKLDRIMGEDQPSQESVSAPTYNQQRDRSNSQPPTSGAGPPNEDETYASMQQQPSLVDNTERGGTETPETGVRGGDDFIQSSFKQPMYADSGVGSSPALSTQQSDGLSKELEAAKSKNAWYASELALAKKAGYRSSSLDSPASSFDDKTADAFGDEEKPLLEALLRMRAELVRVQESFDAQSTSAAERIAHVERQKEAAIAEALYTKSQLTNRSFTEGNDPHAPTRLDDANRRLASTLSAHNDLKAQIQALSQSLDSERRARETAEASADAAHTRAADLDSHKQWSAPEIESLRSQLFEAQRTAREDAEKHADVMSSSRSLDVDNQQLSSQLSSAHENQRNHSNILSTLRIAVEASIDKTSLLERQLEEERQHRSDSEQKLAQLRSQYETITSEYESASKQLSDAKDLVESHATEARTHREAVIAGLGTHADRGFDSSEADSERVSILQQQVQDAKSRAQHHKEQADHESDKRRRAEERIAGLEAFQEQQNREALSFRKQLQSAARDHMVLQASHADLQQEASTHKLDVTAWQMHHEALKSTLGDRGIDTSTLPEVGEYQPDVSSNKRLQQLEEQIEDSKKFQDEMRQNYESREQELRQTRDAEYRALEKECHSMRHGIEKLNKIANQMKQEVDKYKEKNRALREELDQERRSKSASSNDHGAPDIEKERSTFRQLVNNLETRLQKSKAEYESQVTELQAAMSERDNSQQQSAELQRQLEETRADSSELESLRTENQDLRSRATEAENKVHMLLDTVGSSVNNYRRQSQMSFGPSNSGVPDTSHSRGISSNSIGGESTYSSYSGANGLQGSRNSDAQMEAMMNELDTIRGDFERQRQGYGNSVGDASILDGPSPTAQENALSEEPGLEKVSSLADMRRRHLSFNEDDEAEEERARLGKS